MLGSRYDFLQEPMRSWLADGHARLVVVRPGTRSVPTAMSATEIHPGLAVRRFDAAPSSRDGYIGRRLLPLGGFHEVTRALGDPGDSSRANRCNSKYAPCRSTAFAHRDYASLHR